MILIEKTTMIQFDEVAERERIETAFKGKSKAGIRKDLLAILDAFVAGDLARCYKLVLLKDRHWLEYLNETIYDVIDGVHEQFGRQVKAVEIKNKVAAGEREPLPDPIPFGYGFEGVAYPKFQVLAEGRPPAQATVPAIDEIAPMFKEDKKEPQ